MWCAVRGVPNLDIPYYLPKVGIIRFANSKFNSEEPSESLKEVNSQSNKLAKAILATADTIPIPDVGFSKEEWDRKRIDILEHEIWFLCISQFQELLEHCNSTEDFERELFRLRSITFGLSDFLWEWDYIRNLA